MRRLSFTRCLGLVCLAAGGLRAQPFETPLYINMGGPEIVDSFGRTWLGDQGAGADPLGIRPDDAGGPNTIEAWCNPAPETIDALVADALTGDTFDSSHPGDVDLFRAIRWDNGGAANLPDYVLEIPVAPGVYSTSLYFCESCCANRHAKVLLQGDVAFPDVSVASYAGGATHTPGVHTGMAAVGDDGILNITLLGCPPAECPGGGDINPTLTALAIVPVSDDPCSVEGLRVCPRGLECAIEDGNVTGSWSGPVCMEVTGYEVLQDGEVIDSLPADATSFSATTAEASTVFTVRPLVADGQAPCADLTCIVTQQITFDVPLYINLGGPEVVDSFGRTWLGDQGAGADPLSIRPDDRGGSNTIEAWCSPAPATIASLLAETSLGATFNPGHPGDTDLFRAIRWDDGAAAPDYILEIPVPPGSYTTSLYFCESCCPNRHETVVIQGEVAFQDVSVASYAGGATHTPGIHTQEGVIVGDDGILNVTLLGCLEPSCPGGGDGNPTLTALAVVPSDYDPCADEGFISCASGLICTVGAGGAVTGSWNAPACGAADGYEVYRDGELLETLPGDATSFTTTVSERFADFTVRQITAEGAPGCSEQTCSVFLQDALFEVPLRINMGGAETVDSMGRTWLGDGPGAGDPLGIRPNDASATNSIENWEIARFQPDSFDKLGLDPDHPGDRYIFNTIRWDNAADGAENNFLMEIPVPTGEYTVNMYFTEGCCTGRHFKIDVQGAIVDDDVSYLDYDDAPALGRAGLLSFEGIAVAADLLRIGLLPCPECAGASDNNAIIDALEILRTGDLPTVNQLAGDCNQDGAQDVSDILCSVGQLFPGFPLLGRNPDSPCQTAEGSATLLDINGDGVFNTADVVSYADFLFGGGSGPSIECAPVFAPGCGDNAGCQ